MIGVSKHSIIFFFYLLIGLNAFAQKLDVQEIHSEQHFYLNSLSNPGGKSRVLLEVKLPENTIAWCYKYSSYREESDIQKVKSGFKLVSELTRLLDYNTGIISAALQQLTSPPGGDVCDVYLFDSIAEKQFKERNAFGMYEYSRPDFYKEGSRENFYSGVVKITDRNIQKGKYSIGFNNPSLIYGIHVLVSVVAITKIDTGVLVPDNKKVFKLSTQDKIEVAEDIIDKHIALSGGYDYKKKIQSVESVLKIYEDKHCTDAQLLSTCANSELIIYDAQGKEFKKWIGIDTIKGKINHPKVSHVYFYQCELLNRKTNKFKYEYVEKEKIKGVYCYKIKRKISDSKTLFLYFEPSNCNLISVKYITKITPKIVQKSEAYFFDYHRINEKIFFPKQTILINNGVETVVYYSLQQIKLFD